MLIMYQRALYLQRNVQTVYIITKELYRVKGSFDGSAHTMANQYFRKGQNQLIKWPVYSPSQQPLHLEIVFFFSYSFLLSLHLKFLSLFQDFFPPLSSFCSLKKKKIFMLSGIKISNYTGLPNKPSIRPLIFFLDDGSSIQSSQYKC